MTAHEFNQRFAKRVKSERKITNEILQDINQAKDEGFHLELGFSGLFDWLTRGHGYSGSAAQRRIQASRLLRSVPGLSEKLETGKTNLTIAAQTQSSFMQSQKLGRKISDEQKAEVVEELVHNNCYEAERKLMSFFPELAQAPQKDSIKVVAHNRSRMSNDLSDKTVAVLGRVRELLSHKFPEGAMDDVLFHIASYYLDKNDPLRKKSSVDKADSAVQQAGTVTAKESQETRAVESSKSTAVAANRCVKTAKNIPRPVNRVVIQQSDDQCEYCDPITGRRCSSRYQIETDHIRMRALGGTHASQNLRRLCRAHNQFLSRLRSSKPDKRGGFNY